MSKRTDTQPAASWQTGTAAAGTGVTLTLPAPPAGQFHFIVEVLIQRFAAAALVAAATPVVITTTNLGNTPQFAAPADALAQGAMSELKLEPNNPLRSAVAATATTIVCPATTGVIWQANVCYYTGPAP
jgi:hypothetical protein